MSDGLEPPSYRDNPHTIYPAESTTSLYFLSAWCVTTNSKAMLTDGFLLSVSSHAANVPLRTTLKIHRGRLSATSPAHHRMAINHLLHRLDMMCFLALGATSYLTQCENLRSDTIPDSSSDCAVCEYD